MNASEVKEIDEKIHKLWSELTKTFKFTIPSGPLEVTVLNPARAICRRVERRAVKLLRDEVLDEVTYKYLDRLSDLLYVYVKLVAKILGHTEEYLT